jgi:hypothetical protein
MAIVSLCGAGLVAACSESAGGGRDGTGSEADAETAIGEPVTLTVRVVDSNDTRMVLPGIAIGVLDGTTGLPLEPPVAAVSDRDGRVSLTVPAKIGLGIKASGNVSYLDTYIFPFGTDVYHTVIRVEQAYRGDFFGSALPVLDPETAPVRGAVYWKTPEMELYDVVGCAHIEGQGEDLVAQGLGYSAQTSLPSAPSEWPLERGTNPSNGWFHVLNMNPGRHKLVAVLEDGSELGSIEFPVFPRRDSQTSWMGQADHQFLVVIVAEGATGERNPTPVDCIYCIYE